MGKIIKSLVLLAFVLGLACAQSVNLSIPMFDAGGNPVTTGRAFITWAPFIGNNGIIVPGGGFRSDIRNGVLNATLQASDNAGYVYTVLVMNGATPSSYRWMVPAAGASTLAQLNQSDCNSRSEGTWRILKNSGTDSVQFCLSTAGVFQWTALSTSGGSGGSGGASIPTLSSLTASPSATTIALGWNSSAAADSAARCGTSAGSYTVNAPDSGIQTNTTVHQSIISGLVPATTYYCQVTSNISGQAITSTTQATTAALPASTQLSSVSFGSATRYNDSGSHNMDGDTFYNCVASNGTTYLTTNDTYGWDAPYGTGSGSNILIAKLTSESPIVGATVNTLSGFGGAATANGTDNRSPKDSGLFCLAGNLYMFTGRQYNSSGGYSGGQAFAQSAGSIIKSANFGATWDTFQTPNTFTAAGSLAGPTTASMFSGSPSTFGSATFVMYGADDGTLGYTSGYRIDNSDAYIYAIANEGYWNNGSNYYLARVAKAKLDRRLGSDWQFFTGGDGTLDTNWSSSESAATPILTNTNQLSEPNVQYVPSVGRYVLMDYYYPSGVGTGSNTVWLTYEAPHPWGPWTLINTQSWNGQGYYNPIILQRSAINAGSNGNTLTLLTTGNYQSQGTYPGTDSTFKYTLYEIPMTLSSGSYSIASGSSTLSMVTGQTGTDIITETPIGTFAGTVGYSVSGLPGGTTGSFSPATLSGAGTTTLTLNVGSGTAAGNYTVTVTGTYGGGAITKTATFTLTVTAGFAGMLDGGTLPSAQVAYSVARRLSSSYTGSLINVRRSSDNTTQDIGYTAAGDLNQAALTAFVGSGNGFVTKIYDQSGNGYHAVQATAANQAQIVNAGTVFNQDGKPALAFNSATTGYRATVSNTGTSYEIVTVATMISGNSSGYDTLFSLEDGPDGTGGSIKTAGLIVQAGSSAALNSFRNGQAADSSGTGLSVAFGTPFWSDSQANSGNLVLTVGSLSPKTNTTASLNGSFASTFLSIGQEPNSAANYWNGYLSELVGWASNLNAAQQSAAHNNEKAYYSGLQ